MFGIGYQKNTFYKITLGIFLSVIIYYINYFLNILGTKEDFKELIFIKVRSTGNLLKAKINIKGKKGEVKILENETGISPGQACVFYSKDKLGDKVLGGGWIHKTENKNLPT